MKVELLAGRRSMPLARLSADRAGRIDRMPRPGRDKRTERITVPVLRHPPGSLPPYQKHNLCHAQIAVNMRLIDYNFVKNA